MRNYLLDGLYVICEFSDSGDVLREYVPGVSVSIGGVSYFYHYDRLGSVRFISDSSGNVVQEYVYDVWGNLVSSSGSVSQPYEYVGREGYYREEELYLLGQRWYDSNVGRFISRDPIGEKGGLNLYVYVGNNPANQIDETGEGIIACIRCWIRLKCLHDYIEECREEADKAKNCEELVKFINEYEGHDIGSAIWNCIKQKSNNPIFVAETIWICYQCGGWPHTPWEPLPIP